MKRAILLVMLALVVACSTPPKKPVGSHHAHKSSRVIRKRETGTLVTGDWIKKYKQAEAEHGGYTIDEDNYIQPEGIKFRIPNAVRDHYADLVVTP